MESWKKKMEFKKFQQEPLVKEQFKTKWMKLNQNGVNLNSL